MLLLRLAGIDMRSSSMVGGSRFTRPNVSIGRWTYINEGAFFEAKERITVGEHTLFGPNVSILTSNHRLNHDGSPEPGSYALPVSIGSHSLIGANATVCPGVTIGDRVIVAAGAIVSRDLREPGTYGGVPARLLK